MISAAKKKSTTKSTINSDPVAAFLKANSKGDAHAEYTTRTTRKVCHHLHITQYNFISNYNYKLYQTRRNLLKNSESWASNPIHILELEMGLISRIETRLWNVANSAKFCKGTCMHKIRNLRKFSSLKCTILCYASMHEFVISSSCLP